MVLSQVVPICVWWIEKYSEGVIRIIENFISAAVSSMDDRRLNILVQFVEMICKVKTVTPEITLYYKT